MRVSHLLLAAAFVVPSALTGCAASHDLDGDDEMGGTKQPEMWSSEDDPALFNSQVERKLEALPMEGEAASIPWAGSYWPVYQDSINHRWDGDASDSPSKKYEKAFGGTNVEDAVSKYHGIDSRSTATVCKDDSACDSSMGERCGIRPGKTEGRCIPSWWGICHAWGPASILLPEPKNPVTVNGVTFKVQDLKALATLAHNKTKTKFVSLRCNKNKSKDEVKTDEHGRPLDRECRDTNPGTYHLLLANYLGKLKQSFVEDRTIDHEVWNQPMRGYKVLEKRVVSVQEANKLIGVGATGGTTQNKAGSVAKGAWTQLGSFPVVAGQAYRVKTTGSGDADLFVHFGQEPTESSYTCRPYGGTTAEECTGLVPEGATTMFVGLHGYAEKSDFSAEVTTGGAIPSTYVFNAAAKSLVYMSTDVKYVSEASSSTDGNLSSTIDSYTHTDHYEYILELDGAGLVIGGEWVGDSKLRHPDFVWLPLAPSEPTVAGGAIAYDKIKKMIDESVGATVPTTSTTEKTDTQAFKVAKGYFKHFGPYKVAQGTTLTATLAGTGDGDLYVRKAKAPTVSSYDCRPYKGGSAETCSAPGGTDVYVSVRGYAASSDVTLTVKYSEAR